MIEKVIELRKIGKEQPQFFALIFRESGHGEGYVRTIREGSEADLRAFMSKGGISDAEINAFFEKAH
jgi:hypothetical protein